jgi:Ca2+-binding EF-hand superfamily protein
MKSTSLGAVAALAAALVFPGTASAAEGDAMSMFDQLDTSKDSGIDMDEAARSAQVATDFRHIDSDGNGSISREEWRAYFGSTGARPSKTPPEAPGRRGSSY